LKYTYIISIWKVISWFRLKISSGIKTNIRKAILQLWIFEVSWKEWSHRVWYFVCFLFKKIINLLWLPPFHSLSCMSFALYPIAFFLPMFAVLYHWILVNTSNSIILARLFAE
jgi:hypothetical protein